MVGGIPVSRYTVGKKRVLQSMSYSVSFRCRELTFLGTEPRPPVRDQEARCPALGHAHLRPLPLVPQNPHAQRSCLLFVLSDEQLRSVNPPANTSERVLPGSDPGECKMRPPRHAHGHRAGHREEDLRNN